MVRLSDLRSAFFRFGYGRPFSGWRSRQGDYWADEDTAREVVTYLLGTARDAATRIEKQVPSVDRLFLMHAARPALVWGEVIRFTDNVDLAPIEYIHKGEYAVIGREDRVSGAVDLFLHTYHWRLREQSNCVTIEPHQSDAILPFLEWLQPSIDTGLYER